MDGQKMTQAPELPFHMRRNGLSPVEELARAREEGVVRVETPFGLPAYLVCRHEDVRQVLSDPTRFSSALTRSRELGRWTPTSGPRCGPGS
ncbi:hypothetical protein AB8O38_18720 [Saccharomonospora xinjiangensis]|uniref:hypothetical protein n=1 Tax=Saccharomonospora xinjiangensis TaxID=75294 RepID=UPI00350F1C2E